VQIAYRPFDRQWLIPDKRLLAEARTGLWQARSDHQIFITQQDSQEIQTGPGLLFTSLIPDCDHFSGWGGGGVHPLWRDAAGSQPNVAAGLLGFLRARLGMNISPLDLTAYFAALIAHPGYTTRFRDELGEPEVRIPLSADPAHWRAAIPLGQQVIWLHTYGSRCTDPALGRRSGDLAIIERYGVKCDLPIGRLPDQLPEHLEFNSETGKLRVGQGSLSDVPQRVAEHDVAGRRTLWRWLNNRTRNPQHQILTCRELDDINVRDWSHQLDRELLALVSVLTGCVDIEPAQQQLLDSVCSGPLFTVDELRRVGVNLGPAQHGGHPSSDRIPGTPLFNVADW
jgi:hypothetical protein